MVEVRAPASGSVLHRFYLRLLDAHRAGSLQGIQRRAFEQAVTCANQTLSRLHDWQFPARRIDSWLWTSRWQFEILTRWTEWESIVWCPRFIQTGATVIDVGAHIGYYTRYFSELSGARGRVIAIEPHPENQTVLRHNVKRRRNVEVLAFAAAERESVAQLHVSVGSSNHSLMPGYGQIQGVLSIPTRRLDDVLAERNIASVDFIKIDVEGGEPLVLAGLEATIARSPNLHMLIEYNPAALRCGGIEPHALLDQLRAFALDVYRIQPDASLTLVAGELGSELVNLLCCPRGSDIH